MKSHLGRRLEVEGCKGTVMYEGGVEGTKGSWLGVEWDDPTRGKHDGSHAGKVYFRAKGPTSASFVREAKANFGKSFIRAVNERYRTRLEPEVAAQMHVRGTSDQITAVKLVGNEQIAERQSRIDKLEDVHVSDMRVRGAEDHLPPSEENDSGGGGEDGDYPTNCCSLGLGGNLLSTWADVASITRSMPRLRSLHLDENRLVPPAEDELASLGGAFANLKIITLTKMELDWSSVSACFPMWPVLEELVLSNNSITSISASSSSSSSTSSSFFPARLRLVNLDCNPLGDWRNVLPFAALPHLDTLSLAECRLADVEDPANFLRHPGIDEVENLSSSSSSTSTTSPTPFFPSLRHLNLRDNAVGSWLTVAALSRIRTLIELVVLRNPVMTLEGATSAETSRQILLVKMPALTRLNHVYVDPKERRGAEIDYFKKYAADYNRTIGKNISGSSSSADGAASAAAAAAFRFEHPTYDRLVKAFGAPEVVDAAQEKPNVLKKSLISVDISMEEEGEGNIGGVGGVVGVGGEKAFPKLTKKIPPSMSVQKVKMMAAKAWKGKFLARDLLVRVVSEERSFIIDNEMKEIAFYGIQSGDRLVLAKRTTMTD